MTRDIEPFSLGLSIITLFSAALAGCGAGAASSGSPGGGSGAASQDVGASGGAGGLGGASSTGGPADASGGDSSGSGGLGGPHSYALPPPDHCINQYYVDGCIRGDASSECAGLCEPPSAGHNEGKQGEPGYICPRFMLFADEMRQAARDDASTYGWSSNGTAPFEYAVVGHDNDGGILDDPGGASVCCQCYQLIPYVPDEAQVMENGVSSVPLPKPLIVQAFNTGATSESFDVFVGAGGIGAVNACMAPTEGFEPFYSAYPEIGQRFDGGIKAAGNPGNGTACKTSTNMVTTETLGSPGCTDWVEAGCNQIAHEQAWITELTRRSCIESNRPESFYHLNWKVYAKRVSCPVALTEVTGCKLIENHPPVDPNVTTPQAAATDTSFTTGYRTTTMQDCAKPTCAATDHVTGAGHTTINGYDSFYTCNVDGVPWTEND